MKRISVFLLLVLASAFVPVLAQKNFWSLVSEKNIKETAKDRKIKPNRYQVLSLNINDMLSFLDQAPNEFTAEAKTNPAILLLPLPNGSFERFSIVKTTIMEKGLAEQFPNFKTLGGQGIDDPTATVKLDWTDYGFRAQILSSVSGAMYIEPYSFDSKQHYTCFYKNDLTPKAAPIESILLETLAAAKTAARTNAGQCVGGTLRSYRLALACTGEYARAVAGATATVSQALSFIVTSVNRVDGVYETEVAIRLVLITKNASIVFTNPATDPFNGNNIANTLINESQTVITNRIGSINFDIGHTFSTGGGGLAGLGVVCSNSQKASGITGSPSPTGDGYDIDYVAHEMGHQFGGDHTFNANTGSCSGNGSNFFNAEPGSGVTIMAYAGICLATNDLAPHSIPYFHALSLNQITTFSINSTGNNCAAKINTGNTAPVVNAGADYIIPKSTPFMLTGSATDVNGDVLSYSWEQINVGAPFSNWNVPSGNNAPIFRSFNPTTSSTRYFPKLSDQINNTTTIGELLPSYGRPMNFRLTARDNKAGGGGVCFDEMVVTVASVGPFVVTAPNSANVQWIAGANALVTWQVAGTNAAPISAANVNIELSTDGGLTFPIKLKSATVNDGAETIVVPNNPTSLARVRVKANGNIFYDMSNANFAILKDSTKPILTCNRDTSIVTAVCSKSLTLANPTVSDNSGGTISVSYKLTGANIFSSPLTGRNYVGTKTFNVGITTVTYTAKDPSGNVATCSFLVKVLEKVLPSISCPRAVTVTSTTCPTNITLDSVKFTDNCKVTLCTWKMTGATLLTSPTKGINYVGTRAFNKGITTVTYIVKDASLNLATCKQTVTVNTTATCFSGAQREIGITTEDNNIHLFPNPTTSSFVLRLPNQNNQPVNINIYSSEGKKLLNVRGLAKQVYTFGESLLSGTYLIEVKQGDKRTLLKAIKE